MRRMDDAKAEKLMELFLGNVPTKEIAHMLGLTPDAVALKITSLRKEGHNLPRRRRGRSWPSFLNEVIFNATASGVKSS